MSIANGNSTAKGFLPPSQGNRSNNLQGRNENSGFSAGPSASAKASVMLEFQRSSLEMTCRFLETQQRVMLAYLSGTAESMDAPQSAFAAAQKTAFTAPLSHSVAPPPRTLVRESPVQQLNDKSQPIYAEKIALPLESSNAPAPPEPMMLTIEAEPVQHIVSTDYLISSLIEIISERTGYPPEMLDPALDLEADLGIDSIKRVEVLNSFRKLLSADQQTALEDGIEELAGMKTLQSLTDWISNDLVPRISALQTAGPPEFASQAAIGTRG